MDAASALNALKTGDIRTFVAEVDWDECEWIETPDDLRVADENPFIGRFGAVTVGLVKQTESGKYDIRWHNHPNGVDQAKECYATQIGNIRVLLDLAEAMTDSPAVGVVAMSDIPYSGGMYV